MSGKKAMSRCAISHACACLGACALASCGMIPAEGLGAPAAAATFAIGLDEAATPVSPYVYGLNWADDSAVAALGGHVGLFRSGGNRWTGYNWENNASNAGTDWGPNSSDSFLGSSAASGQAQRVAIDEARARGAAALLTLQIVDYVAADKDGPVSQAASPSNPRWKRNIISKGSALSLTPDASDGSVYQDEQVNWIESTFPGARDSGPDIMYGLDNEPGIWNSTHPLIHPAKTTYAEMKERTVAAASMVKGIAPAAKVFGGVCYGFNEFVDLQGAPDSGGRDYLAFLLDSWREAGSARGGRIVDVLDLHWYPEATGGGVRVCSSDSATPSRAEAEARIQAPRSLWDPSYREDSWISDYLGSDLIRLIPRVKETIAAHYPGTGLSFTEYYYGGANHVSGALAQADVLGIMGREGVYAACLWGDAAGFVLGGFAAYLNYDGRGSRVGGLSVPVRGGDAAKASAYAFADGGDGSRAWIVAINKSENGMTAAFDLPDGRKAASGRAYCVKQGQPIPAAASAPSVSGGRILCALPARSVVILEISLVLA